MKLHFVNPAILAAIICSLAACHQNEGASESADSATRAKYVPASVAKESPKQESPVAADAPTTRELLSYYSAHLDEAKTKWEECFNKGLQNIGDAEKPICVAAGNAWHNQPYKPKR